MQIIIDIPKEKYDLCKKWKPSERNELQEAVANGTPLPKGHGELGNLDALAHKMCMADIDNLEPEEVATREEAIEYIREWLNDEYALNPKDRIVLSMALKALQEPCVERRKVGKYEPTYHR